MQTHVYKKVDDCEIHADIYPLESDQKLPAVLFIHGGGLILGHRKAILPSHIKAFHDGRFHFISIDYRLAPETKLPHILTDISDAWAWLQDKADSVGIDSDRIAILGHSAGAFLTLLSGFKLSPRPKALVAIAGYGKLITESFSLPSAYYRQAYPLANADEARNTIGRLGISASGRNDSIQRFTGRGLFYLFCRQQGIWLREVSGHSPDDPEWFTQYEPIHNISAEYPPTMLLHGEPDTDIPFSQSQWMQAELERHGVAHDFLSNPNWGHAFLYMPNDDSVGQAFEQIVTFLQQHV